MIKRSHPKPRSNQDKREDEGLKKYSISQGSNPRLSNSTNRLASTKVNYELIELSSFFRE